MQSGYELHLEWLDESSEWRRFVRTSHRHCVSADGARRQSDGQMTHSQSETDFLIPTSDLGTTSKLSSRNSADTFTYM